MRSEIREVELFGGRIRVFLDPQHRGPWKVGAVVNGRWKTYSRQASRHEAEARARTLAELHGERSLVIIPATRRKKTKEPQSP